MKEQAYTPTGLKIEGQYENGRNEDSRELFQDMIREAYGVRDVIIGHHLVYQTQWKSEDGFTYQLVEEIPAADSLMFDHDVMKRLFPDTYIYVMQELAAEPVSTRDDVLRDLFYNRKGVTNAAKQ